jgi:hypothetical protein
MPLGPDTSYQSGSRIYIKQQPGGQLLNGNTIITEEVTDVGSLSNQYGVTALNGKILPAGVTFSIAPGAATHCVVTIQVVDNGGNAITGYPWDMDLILSDTSTGTGITATTPSGGISITTGTALNTYTANKALYVQSNANGVVVLNITDTAKTGFYVMVQGNPTPLPAVSPQLVTANYG